MVNTVSTSSNIFSYKGSSLNVVIPVSRDPRPSLPMLFCYHLDDLPPQKKFYSNLWTKIFWKLFIFTVRNFGCCLLQKNSNQNINSTLTFSVFILENLTKFLNLPFFPIFVICFNFLKYSLSINYVTSFFLWKSIKESKKKKDFYLGCKNSILSKYGRGWKFSEIKVIWITYVNFSLFRTLQSSIL